ncbi:hypothetical protein KC351_g2914 [Hortaea werneckii]|nr:hypothetical protein KC351_g2914 [Hortaea werneckii]
MVLVTLNSVALAFVFAFSCDPPAKVWNNDIAGNCVNEVAFYFAISGATIGLDLLVIALPFPIIKGLQLDARKKIGLGALFGLGIFVTVVLRVESFAKIKGYTDSQQPITWSMIEIHVVPNAYRMMPVSRDGQPIDEDLHAGDSMEAKATPIQRENEITVTQEIRITDVA